jgi:riboflavin synthase
VFTGIIEEVGTVRRIEKSGRTMKLTIDASLVLQDVSVGDSIAVNGVCLTVVTFNPSSFTVDVMPETFRKTNLERLTPGASVNLERAMALSSRFGGHIVQGHVDCIGLVTARTPEENAVVFRIQPEKPEMFAYIIRGGSITLDGISLTVVDADERTFTVSIIPHTLKATVLKEKGPGDTVNIECDILGKYVHHLLSRREIASPAPGPTGGRITEQFLQENGFI